MTDRVPEVVGIVWKVGHLEIKLYWTFWKWTYNAELGYAIR